MNMHLTNAHFALARGDKIAAFSLLTSALRLANAMNDKARRAIIMRAMSHVISIKP